MKKKLFLFLMLFTFTFTSVACGSMDEDSSSKSSEEEDEDDNDKKGKDDDDNKRDTDDDTDDDKDDDDDVDNTTEPEAIPEPTPEPTPESTPKPSGIVMPDELSDNLYDYQVSINGQVYQLPMWFTDLEAMGWEYQSDKNDKLPGEHYTYEKWKMDEWEIWTVVSNYSINAAKISDCQITSIEIDSDYLDEPVDILLPMNIQLGVSTYEDIIAVYGEPTDLYEGTYYTDLTYEEDYSQSIELNIDVETGVLNCIELVYDVALDGFDNTINPNAPASFTEYAAPSELGTDIFDASFEMEGVKYQFPCPIQEFLNNGFAYEDTDDAEMVVAAGNDNLIYLTYGDITCYFSITNFEDTATYAKNCYVTAVESDFYSVYGSPIALTLSGGIQCNVTTEDEFLAALGDLEYSLYEYDDYKTYSIQDPKVYEQNEYGFYYNSGNFEVRDGIVTKIRREYNRPLKPIY